MILESVTKEILDDMYKEHEKAMEFIRQILRDENKKDLHRNYYNLQTHNFLEKHAWEILLPVSQEEWFKSLQELKRYNDQMPWPQYATYQYCMDVALPPNISEHALYFGYAILEDNAVVRTCFFQWMKLVNYQIMPQGIVMDPLAKIHNIPVKYYVGISVEKLISKILSTEYQAILWSIMLKEKAKKNMRSDCIICTWSLTICN